MTTKPETKFWKIIKNNSSKIHWTRIEAITPVGIPDLNGLFNDPEKSNGEFWCELKCGTDPPFKRDCSVLWGKDLGPCVSRLDP
jgi:hypothetical protein